MPELIESLNGKILQICNLIGELEPEFQMSRPRAGRAKIRFPWGTIQTATVYRNRFPFVQDGIMNTNIAYTLQLTDILRWILNWFDVKHLHFRDNWLLCSGQRFWEIVAATIEERLRLYGSKIRCNFSFVFYVYISETEK